MLQHKTLPSLCSLKITIEEEKKMKAASSCSLTKVEILFYIIDKRYVNILNPYILPSMYPP